jgi:hypothetical protein
MPVRSDNRKKYRYRSVREGTRVRRVYIGHGPVIDALLTRLARQREADRKDAAAAADLEKQYATIDGRVGEFVRECRAAVSAGLYDAGFHQRRGEWRRKRVACRVVEKPGGKVGQAEAVASPPQSPARNPAGNPTP